MLTPPPRAAKPERRDLLAWYDRHRRDLPWRAGPGETPDPYRVWLSEIMLQQTTVAAVKPYLSGGSSSAGRRVAALAAAPLEEVLQAWAGLGYYARARNLHACAQAVVDAARRALPRRPRRSSASFPASAPTRRPRSPRSPSTSRPRRSTAMSSGSVARLFTRRGAAPEGEAGDPGARRGARPGRPAGRFRAGADGSRRHDLHAEAAGLRALPLDGAVPGPRRGAPGDLSAQGAGERRASCAAAPPSWCCAPTTPCCCAAARRPASSAGWRSRRRARGTPPTIPPARCSTRRSRRAGGACRAWCGTPSRISRWS